MPTIAVRILDTAAGHGADGRAATGLIAPMGLSTDRQIFLGFEAPAGWRTRVVAERRTGQLAVLLDPPEPARGQRQDDDPPVLTYRFAEGGPPLTDAVHAAADSRYTRPSAELRADIARLTAGAASQAEALRRIVDAAADLFDYGHPDPRFNDGAEEVPVLSCGLTPGSCIDINTYLVSSAIAAGIPAAYFAGYFFPEERGGVTNDMHCWVVTWADGVQQEWDIAHHIKTGLGRVGPGYNPRPGRRYAMSFGRGHVYDTGKGPGGTAISLSHFSEPEWRLQGGETERAALEIRLTD